MSTKPPTGDPAGSSSEHHETRPEDRVSPTQRIVLGVGAFPFTTGTQIVQVMLWPIAQFVLGLHPLLAGLALTITRFWDAISDPVMGYISDNFRSRFGRRRPFIVVGAFLLALTLVAIWLVPRSWTRLSPEAARGEPVQQQAADDATAEGGEPEMDWRDGAMFGYLVLTSLLFYTAFTVFSVPLVSLSYEMTPDYHERTRVMATWGLFTLAGNLCISLYYPITENRELFDDALQGALAVSLGVGVFIFVGLGVLPGLFVKERVYRAASKQERISLLPAVWEAIRCRPMLVLLGMILVLAFVGAMAAAMAPHIVIFYVFGGDRQLGAAVNGLNGVLFQVVGLASIPLLAWMARRFGKRQAMFVVLAMAAAGGVAKWFIYTPELPYLLLLDGLLSGPVWIALSVLVPAMMADLCDVDEYEYGKRREGVFGAVFSWVQKLGFSLTFLFSGIAVWLSGFDVKSKIQPEETLLAMRLCFAGFSVLAGVLGIALFFFYNVSEQRAYEVRELLEQRRGKAWSDEEL